MAVRKCEGDLKWSAEDSEPPVFDVAEVFVEQMKIEGLEVEPLRTFVWSPGCESYCMTLRSAAIQYYRFVEHRAVRFLIPRFRERGEFRTSAASVSDVQHQIFEVAQRQIDQIVQRRIVVRLCASYRWCPAGSIRGHVVCSLTTVEACCRTAEGIQRAKSESVVAGIAGN